MISRRTFRSGNELGDSGTVRLWLFCHLSWGTGPSGRDSGATLSLGSPGGGPLPTADCLGRTAVPESLTQDGFLRLKRSGSKPCPPGGRGNRPPEAPLRAGCVPAGSGPSSVTSAVSAGS